MIANRLRSSSEFELFRQAEEFLIRAREPAIAAAINMPLPETPIVGTPGG